MPDPTPLATPIETRPTPEVLDTLFYEFVDPTNDTVRQPYGSEHPNTAAFPGFKLVKEERLGYKSAKRWYANDPVNADTWNYSLEYSGHSNSHQIFARRYMYRRDTYAAAGPLAKQSLFTGVYLIRVTDGGEHYDEPPAVTLSGGGGTGATARSVINKSGEVTWVLLVTEGTGYITAPTVAFSGGGGTGAAATAFVQPAACYLVEEKASELGADDPRQSLYLAVVRIYEVLPGPWLPFTRYDLLLGPIQGRRRAVLSDPTQIASLSATAKTTYEAREGSSIVSWQIEETNTTGEGTAENPFFPITVRDYFDPQKGPVQETTQTVVATGFEVGSSTVVGGVVTEIRYEPINEFLLKKIIETWSVPVNRTDKEMVTVHGGGISTRNRETSGAQSSPTGGMMIIEDESTDLGGGVFNNKLSTVAGSEWPVLNWTHVDEKTGIVISGTKQVVAAGTAGGNSGTVYTEVRDLDKWRSIQISTTLPVAGDLPADFTFRHKRPKSFPDVVTDIEFIAIDITDAGADASIRFKINQGYSGDCEARTKRKYMTAAQYAAYTPPAIMEFFPEGFQFAILHTGRGRIWQPQIPISLHDAYSGAATGFTGVDVPATTPASVPLSTWIYVDVQPNETQLGIWIVDEVEILTPSQ